MTSKRLLAVLFSAALWVSMAAPAHAHARLVSSTPVGGSTISDSPPEVVLEFNERIETSFGGVQIFAPDGNRLATGDPEISGSTVKLQLEELPESGDYTVAFRVISADSHPVESRFAFAYRPPEAAPSPSPSIVPPAPPAQGPRAQDVELQDAGPVSSGGLWLSRLLNYLASALVVGLLVGAGYLLRESDRRRRALRLAGRAALVWALSTVALFVFGLSVAAALPVPEALRGDLPGRFADTRFGQGVVVQGILAAAAFLAFRAARRHRSAFLIAVALVGVALLAPALWGHAGTAALEGIALASDWAHLAAVTSWVGGLAVLAFFVLAPGEQADPEDPSRRFSKLAGIAVGVVLLTGSINAVMRIDKPGQLFSTEWGRLVLVKLALFAVIALLGYRNRNRMLPALSGGSAGARAAFRKLALVELLFMMLSFGAATALASTIPADAEAASRIQTVVTQFGPGQINLTVDPATTGENVMHLYFLDSTGRPLEVMEPSLSLAMPGVTLEPQLFDSGPGHYTILSQIFDREGDYSVVVTANVQGNRHTATGSLSIR